MALVLRIREGLRTAPVVKIPLREIIEAAGGRFWKLPAPVVAEVFRLWDAGRNTVEIADAVGISESAAADYVRTHRERGDPRRPPHYGRVREVLEKRGPELRTRYEAGETIQALATSVRLHSMTLRRYLVSEGVEIRRGSLPRSPPAAAVMITAHPEHQQPDRRQRRRHPTAQRHTMRPSRARASRPPRPRPSHYQRVRQVLGGRETEICEAYEGGESLASLGGRLGLAPLTIRTALVELGVDIRPRPGWRPPSMATALQAAPKGALAEAGS